MTMIFATGWKKQFLPAKTIFTGTVFSTEKTGFSTQWQKLANPAANDLNFVYFDAQIKHLQKP